MVEIVHCVKVVWTLGCRTKFTIILNCVWSFIQEILKT